MKKLPILLLVLCLLLVVQTTAAQGAPEITSFTSTTSIVDRNALNNRTVRVPVSWATSNRPGTANLVFEQVLSTGVSVNVELPRSNPYVASSGDGVVAPVPDPGNTANVLLQIRLIDTRNLNVLATRDLVLPIGDAPQPEAIIRSFTLRNDRVSRSALTNRTARIPVSWVVENRPANSNLVFEQVLGNGTAVNVELPRSNPIIASAGDGVVAPTLPGNNATTVDLRLRLIDIGTQNVYAEKLVSLPIDESTSAAPAIRTFSSSATSVRLADLTARTARVPVSWVVDNRPANSNLVFEQVLADGTSVNVELPRSNPIVSSSGDGTAAAVPPGGSATTIQLRLRLVDLGTQSTYVQRDITVAIDSTAPPPASISAFSSSATSVNRNDLVNRTARIPVTWAVQNRPSNSNLVFEQVLANGSVVNVELPRSNPIVPSSGNGTAAPVLPGETATTVQLRLRLIDITSQSVYDEETITLTIAAGGGTAPAIRTFTSAVVAVPRGDITGGSARIPVTWVVDNRPPNSNLVFEQVLGNGSAVNVELPRTVPIVPSSGNGVVAPVMPGGSATTVQLRLRLIDLTSQSTLAQSELTLNIVEGGGSTAVIRTFVTSATSVDPAALANRSARIPVSWIVDNRPANSNLVFEQVMDNGSVINIELPRTVPIVPSSGLGVVAPAAPTNTATDSIVIRLRLVNLGNNATLKTSEISLPLSGRSNQTVWEQVSNCYSAEFRASIGISAGDTGRVANTTEHDRIVVSDKPLHGLVLGDITNGTTFTVLEGPVCYRITTSGANPITRRLWRVQAAGSALQGWVNEYSETSVYLEPDDSTLPETGPGDGDGAGPSDDFPVIISFTAAPTSVERGATVTLSWEVTNATEVRLNRLTEDGGAVAELLLVDVGGNGSLEYPLPADYVNNAPFTLIIKNDAGAEVLQAVSVSITCPFAASLSDDCPLSQSTAQLAYQPFERGHMIWRGDTLEIIVLYEDGSYEILPDTYVAGEPENPGGEPPPVGLFQPVQGFGKVFNQIGGWSRLGWATAEEVGYSGIVEIRLLGDAFSLPDGRAARLENTTWTIE